MHFGFLATYWKHFFKALFETKAFSDAVVPHRKLVIFCVQKYNLYQVKNLKQ